MNLHQNYTHLHLHGGIFRVVLVAFILTTILTGCSPASPETFYRAARQMGLERHVIQAGTFPLVIYTRGLTRKTPHLHLYLGGDGLPWKSVMTPSDDPSPHDPLVLNLMQQDKNPSLFLGRPCYQGFAKQTPCHHRYWTSARYSPEVINTLSLAIKKIIRTYHVRKLTLIGYSGGGTLAVLLAPHIPEITTVITIAANLDTDAWTKHHGYSPLSESLNPALQPALANHIRQLHLQGDRDITVPPDLSARFFRNQTQACRLRFATANHTCCWRKKWPEILNLAYKTPCKQQGK